MEEGEGLRLGKDALLCGVAVQPEKVSLFGPKPIVLGGQNDSKGGALSPVGFCGAFVSAQERSAKDPLSHSAPCSGGQNLPVPEGCAGGDGRWSEGDGTAVRRRALGGALEIPERGSQKRSLPWHRPRGVFSTCGGPRVISFRGSEHSTSEPTPSVVLCFKGNEVITHQFLQRLMDINTGAMNGALSLSFSLALALFLSQINRKHVLR